MARTTLAVPSGRRASFWSALRGWSALRQLTAPSEKTEKISLVAASQVSPQPRKKSSAFSKMGVSTGS